MPFNGSFNKPGNLLADDTSHASAHESEFEGGNLDRNPVNFTFTTNDSLFGGPFGDCSIYPVLIAFAIPEIEKINRLHVHVIFHATALVKNKLKPFPGGNAKVIVAFWTDIEIILNVL
jgi:hypothetical protein